MLTENGPENVSVVALGLSSDQTCEFLVLSHSSGERSLVGE